MADKQVAVVVGVGHGLGAALGRRFASAGMTVALAARRADKLEGLAGELEGVGGTGRAYKCDATEDGDVARLFDRVRSDLGAPDLVVYNAGAFVPKGVLETDEDAFVRCWRVGCLGGFLVGRRAARDMVERFENEGRTGTIIFTGATASLRGSANFVNLAVGKFGLRALAQSMARELGPRGVHVAHVIIDGQILSERYAEQARKRPPDALLEPAAIADVFYGLHRQPRSAWTHELDLRPWVERF